MKLMAIEVIYPKQNTSKSRSGDSIYPYLLRGMKIDRCHQVWETDITYIAMSHDFIYLAAIMDVYSSMVVNWDISNTMDSGWCKELVVGAIDGYGVPEIINTDQGSQFTRSVFQVIFLIIK